MMALLWLVLAFIFGWFFAGRLFGQTSAFLQRIAPQKVAVIGHPLFEILFRAAAAIWLGILPLTWLTYLSAALAAAWLPKSIHPLSLVNPLLLLIGYGILIGRLLLKMKTQDRWPLHTIARGIWPAFMRHLQQRTFRFFLLTAGLWLAFAAWLMTLTFHQDGDWIRAGYSVFSDFAPHTALISSFSQGRNFPTQYPHFALDGIAYHFLFFFLCGNLNFLGLPLALAINLPSILGVFSFAILLGSLAVTLTGFKATYLIAPALLFLRSSLAFFTQAREQIAAAGFSLSGLLSHFWNLNHFIGNTPRDDWGLWGINVYANQRHFLAGMVLLLLLLFIFLPDLMDNLRDRIPWHRSFFSADGWRLSGPDDRRRLRYALLIGILMPYFHGSATVAALLILAGMALWSRARLSYALTAGVTILAAMLQSAFFTQPGSESIRPQLQIGFIASDPSFTGILTYLVEMSGLVLPLFLIVILTAPRQLKPLYLSFLLPLFFAFTVSLTPDVTVNHKYIMISIALANIAIAGLLCQWAAKPESDTYRLRFARLGKRLVVLILAFTLTITGLAEFRIVRNLNEQSMSIHLEGDLATWIRRHTPPDAVFVTAPHHYHEFFLSGRHAWFGHAYYAWSAGHDTLSRHEQMNWLLAGGDGDLTEVRAMIRGERLDYLLIDDTLREHPEFDLDESFFEQHFEKITAIPAAQNAVIYGLR